MTLEDTIRSELSYDPETGIFRWKASNKGRVVGGIAGGVNTQGYVVIGFYDKRYYAHRLAWLFAHGEWPKQRIDHIDRNRSNNRISNLRDVSGTVNNFNSGLRSDNQSGHKGVTWCPRRSNWRAVIRGRSLGSYATKEEAIAARQAAELKLETN